MTQNEWSQGGAASPFTRLIMTIQWAGNSKRENINITELNCSHMPLNLRTLNTIDMPSKFAGLLILMEKR